MNLYLCNMPYRCCSEHNKKKRKNKNNNLIRKRKRLKKISIQGMVLLSCCIVRFSFISRLISVHANVKLKRSLHMYKGCNMTKVSRYYYFLPSLMLLTYVFSFFFFGILSSCCYFYLRQFISTKYPSSTLSHS